MARREKGISFQTVELCTGRRDRTLVTQRMRRMLAIFEPTIFPRAISLLPFILARTLTVSSGMEVPKATTVRPMTRLEIPNFFALDAEPETRKSAPFISIAKPIIMRKRASIMRCCI